MRGPPFIAGFGKTLRMALCLFFAAGIMFLPVQNSSRASHENPALFGPGDGALDYVPHRDFIYYALRENYVASLMMMTEQFVTLMMEQMLVVATFMDADQQLEVQRLFQELTAEAHKDFHSSWQMCSFGTLTKSIALADRNSVDNFQILDQMMEKREHLHANLAASGGTSLDITHRVRMFKDIFCDLAENNRHVELMCNMTSGPITRVTKDIDYQRVIDNQYTLDANYADLIDTEEEQDILALGHNLYAGTVIDFIPQQVMNETAGQNLFLETRSLHAIRSVARRSFTTMVGLKAEGDMNDIQEVTPYLYGVVFELGVPLDELSTFLGDNPSYFAQMEVLTRKIYHAPDFFTNLYDKPANVRRIGVSLQALELMQDRDRFEGALRREMLISLILELKLRGYQEDMYSVLYSTVNKKFGPPEL